MERMEFEDLAPREVEVRIGKKEYILTEAMADVEVKYHNASVGDAQLDPETKRVRVGSVANGEPLAVSLCLFELRTVGTIGKQRTERIKVSLDQVLKWKPEVYQSLFKKLVEISPGLIRDDKTPKREEQEKNSQEGGTDTSDSLPNSESNSTNSSDGINAA